MINGPEHHEPISTANEPNIIEPKGLIVRKPYAAVSMAVKSLKHLQNETRALEVAFFEQVYQLETEFEKKHQLVYHKRNEIVNGDNISNDTGDKVATGQRTVPNFWLKVLASALLQDIHENDRPILEHLTDVRVRNKPLSDLGFILEFHFSPNDYFENAVLSKEYFYTSSDNKMIHEIPLINQSVGSVIEWKHGKAPTHRSWFEFLASSKNISDSDEEFMAYISGIQKDFEMGYFIKEQIVPKAVLYFTGEERNFFTICNYNAGFWSPVSSTSSNDGDDDSVSSSKGEAKSGLSSSDRGPIASMGQPF